MTEQSGGGDDGVVDTPLEASEAPLVANEEREDAVPPAADEIFGDDVEVNGRRACDLSHSIAPPRVFDLFFCYVLLHKNAQDSML